MERGINKKRENTIESIKNVLLVLLFVSSVIFAAAYIVGTQQSTISPDVKMPYDRLHIIRSGDTASYVEGLREDMLLPEAFAYNVGTQGRLLLANRDLMRDMNRLLSEYYGKLMSSGAKCSLLGKTEGERQWAEALSGSYIYVRYPSALPYPVICAYHEDDTDNAIPGGDSDIVYAEELLIILGDPDIASATMTDAETVIDAGAVTALSRTENGNYARYTPNPDAVTGVNYNIGALTAYNGNKSFVSFRFSDENDNEIIPGTPLVDEKYTANAIELAFADPISLFDDAETKNYILKLFSYNPDNIRSYTSEGRLIFVSDHGALSLDSDGRISYEAEDAGGIELSGILGYGNYGGEYSLFESLAAACGVAELIGREAPQLVGGKAELRLTGISADDDGITCDFSYFYNNIILLSGGDERPAMRVSISDNKLVSLSLETVSVSDTLISEVVLSRNWTLRNLYGDTERPGRLTLAYVTDVARTTDEGAPSAHCAWVLGITE